MGNFNDCPLRKGADGKWYDDNGEVVRGLSPREWYNVRRKLCEQYDYLLQNFEGCVVHAKDAHDESLVVDCMHLVMSMFGPGSEALYQKLESWKKEWR